LVWVLFGSSGMRFFGSLVTTAVVATYWCSAHNNGRAMLTANFDGNKMPKTKKEPINAVQVFGRKKTATAVAYCKRGRGLLRVNGRPLDQIEPKVLQYKLQEPILLLGKEKFAGVDIRIRVSGGGHVAQIYAIRQAVSRALVSYYQKYVDEASRKELKDILTQYDRTLLANLIWKQKGKE